MNHNTTASDSSVQSSIEVQVLFILAIVGIAVAMTIPRWRVRNVSVVEHSKVQFQLNATSQRCTYDVSNNTASTVVQVSPSQEYPFQFTPFVEWEAEMSDGTNINFQTGLEFNWDMETLSAFQHVENYGKPEEVVVTDAYEFATYIWSLKLSDRKLEIRLLFQIRTKNDHRILIEQRHSVIAQILPVPDGE